MKKSISKVNPARAAHYLAAHYPQIKEEIYTLSKNENFAGVLQAIVNYLRMLLTNSEIRKISRLIKFVGCLYPKGNEYIKYIIENLFVRSFEGIRKRSTPQQWQFLFQNFPPPFKNIYLLQNENNLINHQ